MGPFNSGTNIISRLIRSLTKYLEIDLEGNTLLWKHTINKAKIINFIKSNPDTLFICTYRPFYNWFSSTIIKSHKITFKDKKTAYNISDECYFSEWAVYGKPISQDPRHFLNIIDFYNTVYNMYIDLIEKHENVISLNYYDYVNPKKAFENISKKLKKFNLAFDFNEFLPTLSRSSNLDVTNTETIFKKQIEVIEKINENPENKQFIEERLDTNIVKYFESKKLNCNKLFFIGFNKTGTTSIDQLFKLYGYNSCHNSYWWYCTLENRYHNDKVINDISIINDHQVLTDGFELYFPDMPVLPNLEELDKLYPNSKYIYQTRNLKAWLISRLCEKNDKSYHFCKNINDVLLEMTKLRNYWYRTIITHFENRTTDLLIINYIDDDNSLDQLNKFLNTSFIVKINKGSSKKRWGNDSKAEYKKIVEDFLKEYVLEEDWKSNFEARLLTNKATTLFVNKNYF